jgi:hypothetical protein
MDLDRVATLFRRRKRASGDDARDTRPRRNARDLTARPISPPQVGLVR